MIQENISMEEWKKHFLFEGSKNDRKELDKRSLEGDQEENLKNEEIEEQKAEKKKGGRSEIGINVQ